MSLIPFKSDRLTCAFPRPPISTIVYTWRCGASPTAWPRTPTRSRCLPARNSRSRPQSDREVRVGRGRRLKDVVLWTRQRQPHHRPRRHQGHAVPQQDQDSVAAGFQVATRQGRHRVAHAGRTLRRLCSTAARGSIQSITALPLRRVLTASPDPWSTSTSGDPVFATRGWCHLRGPA